LPSARRFSLSLSFLALGIAAASCRTEIEPAPGPQAGSETHWVIFADPCSFESCGTVPSSLDGETVLLCTTSGGTDVTVTPDEAECEWTEGDDPNEQLDSVTFCEEAECGARPAPTCPDGTVESAIKQSCYDVGAGCSWYLNCPQPGPGEPCNTHDACASGICEGVGCGELEGRCVPVSDVRECTDDFVSYCGCDGVTFGASGSCPDQRYAHVGECP
jgi:hypothetical protein